LQAPNPIKNGPLEFVIIGDALIFEKLSKDIDSIDVTINLNFFDLK
jgi:hypothetical protein